MYAKVAHVLQYLLVCVFWLCPMGQLFSTFYFCCKLKLSKQEAPWGGFGGTKECHCKQ
jgi:hypothetical protein